MSEIRVTSIVGENGGDRVGLTTGLTVGPLTGTTGIGATISHHGNASFTGIVTATNVSAASSVTAATFYGSGANLTNVKNFPQVSVSSQHTIVASDVGKHIKNTSGGWIVNGSTGFAVGDVCRVVNASGSSQVVTQSGVTLYSRRDGGVSGNHSIVARGAAIIICTGSNEYYVSGDI